MPETAIEAEFVNLNPQPTAAVRVQQPMATVDVGALMDEAMSRLGERLGGLRVAPAGPPYARYHAWGGELADVEIGFPLTGRPEGLDDLAACEPGEVGASELPGGRAALTVHRGPYTELGSAYGQLHDWIHEQGFDEGPAPWESYVDNPAEVQDVAQLRTEITWPVPDR